MFISIQYIFDRLFGARSRAEELRAVRRRLFEQAGPGAVGHEEVQLALALRGLREKLGAQLGSVEACTCCVRPRSAKWPGGQCCSGRTEALFTDDELGALKLSGTTSLHLRSPRADHEGCVFRGTKGCSLPPAHRPSLCVRYMCFDLQRELDLRADAEETNRLQQEIQNMSAQFVNLRQARCEAQAFEALVKSKP